MSKRIAIFVISILVSACATQMPIEPLPADAKTEFTYDYSIPDTEKATLWKRARDHFAGAYGDSRSVFRVMDESEGTIIGKGVSFWAFGNPPYTVPCLTEYHIRFAAKDNKARLQISLINEVPASSRCTGWPLPTKIAYQEIVSSFVDHSNSLETALNGGGDVNDFKNF
tara:strand:- start:468 stop:974 length:507 start_codon:yes stop_codon:yes gene_type:complete